MLSSLIFIHGLNNQATVLKPLSDALCTKEVICHHIILPGHDQKREITTDTKAAQESFRSSIEPLTKSPYKVIAFSQGALYFELMLGANKEINRPKQAIYFAPAFYIKNKGLINFATKILPDKMKIPSYAPVEIRNHDSLYVYEYKNLINLNNEWLNSKKELNIEAYVLMDKDDELVDSQKTAEIKNTKFELIERKKVKKWAHHLVVHPNFYEQKEWAQVILKIKSYLSR